MRRSRMSRLLALPLLLVTGYAIAGDAIEQLPEASPAETPVLELYLGERGARRYDLDPEWLLSMGLGVSPLNMRRERGADRYSSRWHPHFALYESERSREQTLSPLSRPVSPRVRWFWTVESNASDGGPLLANGYDIATDVLRSLSLQTRAGFVLPFGQNWLLGAAVTVDHRLSPMPSSPHQASDLDETSAGAYIGLRLGY